MIVAESTIAPMAKSRHRLHTQERSWAETNCYVDVWIELLHHWGLEPMAALPFTTAIDFEGDQWTFFKFPHADLYELFGIDVQELAIWRPLEVHLAEQIDAGRPVLIELDSFYLPDTAGTAYQQAHVKSTVAAMEIDLAERRLGYFHGQGYYELRDEDFLNVLRMQGDQRPGVLPPFAEIAKRMRPAISSSEQLAAASISLLRRYLERAPNENPFEKFKPRFDADLEWLGGASLEMFHAYSFATLRQFGAAFECAATYLKWLSEQGVERLEEATSAFTELSTGGKTLQFQLARAMARKKKLDLSSLDEMGATWQRAIDGLKLRFG